MYLNSSESIIYSQTWRIKCSCWSSLTKSSLRSGNKRARKLKRVPARPSLYSLIIFILYLCAYVFPSYLTCLNTLTDRSRGSAAPWSSFLSLPLPRCLVQTGLSTCFWVRRPSGKSHQQIWLWIVVVIIRIHRLRFSPNLQHTAWSTTFEQALRIILRRFVTNWSQ